eukprot:RCo016135
MHRGHLTPARHSEAVRRPRAAPHRGSITAPGTAVRNAACGLLFQSMPGAWGLGFTSFTYSVTQIPQLEADMEFPPVTGVVTFDVSFADALPTLRSEPSASALQGTESVPLELNATDVNGHVVIMTLGSLPTKGVLYLDGSPITALTPGLVLIKQWVSSVLGYSSQYEDGYDDQYHAKWVEGPPTVDSYGDDPTTWCVWNRQGYASLDARYTYTDYLEVQYETKVYPSQL